MGARFFVMILLLAGCAAIEDPVVKEARELVSTGRGEQALALLQQDPRQVAECRRRGVVVAGRAISQYTGLESSIIRKPRRS